MNTQSLQKTLSSGEGYLIVSPRNRRYFTDFNSSDGYLLVTACESVFLTDSRYIEAARNQVKDCSEIEMLVSLSAQLPEYIKKLGIKKLYTEAETLTVYDFGKISSVSGCETLAEKTDEAISTLRRIKSQEEKNLFLNR